MCTLSTEDGGDCSAGHLLYDAEGRGARWESPPFTSSLHVPLFLRKAPNTAPHGMPLPTRSAPYNNSLLEEHTEALTRTQPADLQQRSVCSVGLSHALSHRHCSACPPLSMSSLAQSGLLLCAVITAAPVGTTLCHMSVSVPSADASAPRARCSGSPGRG